MNEQSKIIIEKNIQQLLSQSGGKSFHCGVVWALDNNRFRWASLLQLIELLESHLWTRWRGVARRNVATLEMTSLIGFGYKT